MLVYLTVNATIFSNISPKLSIEIKHISKHAINVSTGIGI